MSSRGARGSPMRQALPRGLDLPAMQREARDVRRGNRGYRATSLPASMCVPSAPVLISLADRCLDAADSCPPACSWRSR